MGMKVKDYYDYNYAHDLAEKIGLVYPAFPTDSFLSFLKPTLEQLEFNDRQTLLAQALKESIPLNYRETIQIFEKILGPELEGSLGMFTEGYWLWPIGKYVELYGDQDFETSTAFSKELTKRFTSEFCMRPVILAFPEQAMALLLNWSLDDNKRVRRLASECLRIRLPWAKKMYVALDYFDSYSQLLTNLKDDSDKTTQKSVANNLNDLYKEDPQKFAQIISSWETKEMTKECVWIIKHASRTKRKRESELQE
ncbi:DNA alkylation repair protein [Enterococcus sp. BWR-S5]|uniref:DNA alkylation repair protein n=1 Tax=Enterococcus sp. BWR-S5 TaxID=2787714 RepID=UPI0019247F4E|nr:DNA alkylation repair protein [Enterococcus sp. BWR-S5]MBL1225274.1 DNA alkylation repair protein [Enterococcus sp. BWR-S5]